MKLRACHVLFALVLVQGRAQRELPPLPAPSAEVVSRFRLALDAVFGMGIRLQAFLNRDEENFLVSPVSTATIIAQLILGAEGRFRKQLVELLALPNSHLYENEMIRYHSKKENVTYFLPYTSLHLQLSNLLKALESEPDSSKHFTLRQKSALFLDNRIALNDTFKMSTEVLYESRIHHLNFTGNPAQSQRVVNAWVAHSTNGLIKAILASPPPPTTSSIFANAIYFKGEWQTPFSDTLNRKGYFNVSANKVVPVTYMINHLDQILYAESEEYRVVALPYVNEELGMYILLPRSESRFKYDMKGFIQYLKFSEVLGTVAGAKRRDVVVKIPKMSISYKFSILDQLKKYRVFKQEHIKTNSTNPVDKLEARVDAFANFTGDDGRDIFLTTAAVGEHLRVDDIVQEVVISINEKGTEAAAVSAATIDYMGGSKNFVVERPFVFFIRHELTSASLFWGTVTNPAA